LEQLRRQVDTRNPRSPARGTDRRVPGPARDVEHVLAFADADRVHDPHSHVPDVASSDCRVLARRPRGARALLHSPQLGFEPAQRAVMKSVKYWILNSRCFDWNLTMSPIETRPITSPSSTTGMCRMRRSVMIAMHSSTEVSGVTMMSGDDMISLTCVS